MNDKICGAVDCARSNSSPLCGAYIHDSSETNNQVLLRHMLHVPWFSLSPLDHFVTLFTKIIVIFIRSWPFWRCAWKVHIWDPTVSKVTTDIHDAQIYTRNIRSFKAVTSATDSSVINSSAHKWWNCLGGKLIPIISVKFSDNHIVCWTWHFFAIL